MVQEGVTRGFEASLELLLEVAPENIDIAFVGSTVVKLLSSQNKETADTGLLNDILNGFSLGL
ncbi:MAG: hypothetical protein GY861_28140 [bacterium]|nr:hypothetical protein [bacterium]